MMEVRAADVPEFLLWVSQQLDKPFTLENDLKMSFKIYKGDLCTFTTIQPGKHKDDYWCNEDMCSHLLEAVQICKWVHRNILPRQLHPELVFIFDGSSNHGARASNALHVGGGINRDPGGQCTRVKRHSKKSTWKPKNAKRLVLRQGHTCPYRTGNA